MKLIPVLSYKVVLFISVILVSVVFYAPSLYLLDQNQQSKIDIENSEYELSVERNIERMISYAVNKGDRELLKAVLSNVKSYEFIHSITVVDNMGNVIGYVNNIENYQQNNESPEQTGTESALAVESKNAQSIINAHYATIFKEDYEQNFSNNTLSAKKGSDVIGKVTISFVEPVIDSESINKSFNNILLISGIFSLIPILIVFVVFREQNNQLRIILESAKRLARGERAVKLSDKTGIKEIEEFSNAFNEISDELERGRDNLVKKGEVYDMKSNILQLAAHELRTPMGRVRTYLDMAIERTRTKRPVEAMETLRLAYGDVDSITRRISYILNLSALENGSLKIKNECFDVQEMFGEIDHQFGVLCENSSKNEKISWRCHADNSCPMWVVNDFQLISVIVSNAIDNAIKYTDKGFVEVYYAIEDGSLNVMVKDTGVGLNEKELKDLRETNPNFENTITRTKDGWGIGFKTMRRFAVFMNGSVEIQSSKGFGTEIQISIPVTLATESEIAIAKGIQYQVEEEPETEKRKDGNNEASESINLFKIIVIDNDLGNIEQMKHLFDSDLIGREDIQVTYIDDPVEAIDKLESIKFDLILMDYHMPEMDGMDLLRFIRDQPTKNKHTKKIVITADSAISDVVYTEMTEIASEVTSKGFTIKDILRWTNTKRSEPKLVSVPAGNLANA